jgi:hypothetical protein
LCLQFLNLSENISNWWYIAKLYVFHDT